MTSSGAWSKIAVAEALTLAEALRAVLVLSALALSLWALVDDVWDLINVSRYGEVDGPRWVAALEHLLFNGTLLIGWLCYLMVVSIAIYLPRRTDPVLDFWATLGGWGSLGFAVCVLLAQIHRRVGRVRLKSLPLAAWERMLASMVDGLTPEQREPVTARLLASTTAGRELGHVIANETAPAIGLIDLVLATAVLTERHRADLVEAQEHIAIISERGAALHQEIKRLGGAA